MVAAISSRLPPCPAPTICGAGATIRGGGNHSRNTGGDGDFLLSLKSGFRELGVLAARAWSQGGRYADIEICLSADVPIQ